MPLRPIKTGAANSNLNLQTSLELEQLERGLKSIEFAALGQGVNQDPM